VDDAPRSKERDGRLIEGKDLEQRKKGGEQSLAEANSLHSRKRRNIWAAGRRGRDKHHLVARETSRRKTVRLCRHHGNQDKEPARKILDPKREKEKESSPRPKREKFRRGKRLGAGSARREKGRDISGGVYGRGGSNLRPGLYDEETGAYFAESPSWRSPKEKGSLRKGCRGRYWKDSLDRVRNNLKEGQPVYSSGRKAVTSLASRRIRNDKGRRESFSPCNPDFLKRIDHKRKKKKDLSQG